MPHTFFVPLVLRVDISEPFSFSDEAEIEKKIDKRLKEFLIYWEQTNGTKVTARLEKTKWTQNYYA